MNSRFVAIAALALSASFAGFAAPDAARADDAPAAVPVATPYPIPSLPGGANVDATIRTIINAAAPYVGQMIGNRLNSNVGHVTYFRRFEMQINDGNNRYTNVHLHQGTTIDPRGETIQVGDLVEVGGVKNADGSLNANAITIHH